MSVNVHNYQPTCILSSVDEFLFGCGEWRRVVVVEYGGHIFQFQTRRLNWKFLL